MKRKLMTSLLAIMMAFTTTNVYAEEQEPSGNITEDAVEPVEETNNVNENEEIIQDGSNEDSEDERNLIEENVEETVPTVELDASYPTVFPKYLFDVAIIGDKHPIEYTYFPEFKNEKLVVDVYDPSGNHVATSERTFYNSSSLYFNYTVNWDTTGYKEGEYKVVATSTFYTMYSWHEAPKPTTSYITLRKPFKDVTKKTLSYYTPVYWALRNGITKGTSDTTFSPDKSCTRGEFVTFLWRANGQPSPTISNPFTDVKENLSYYKAVLWAYEKGITTGTSDTTFSPSATCTRAQVATFLWRAQGSPEPTNQDNPFIDVQEGRSYTKAVMWAYENDITTGTSENEFSPNKKCTRAQTVTFLYRVYKDK